MIQRLYIHNYRCFENLDLNFSDQSSVLVLGKNGTGKSSLGSALRILQDIAKGSNRIRQFLKLEDFAQNRTDVPIRIEVSVELDGKIYEYSIAFEFPEGFREPRVKDEKLMFDGAVVYSRQEAQVELAATSVSFLVDWHVVALPIVQIRGQDNPIEMFRSWMSRLVLIAPVPTSITSESTEESLYPDEHVGWLQFRGQVRRLFG